MMKRTLLFTLLTLLAFTAIAVPARRDRMVYSQPDGSRVGLRLVGDEFGHFFLTDDDQMVLRDNTEAFYFAQLDPQGAPVASAVLASDPLSRTASQTAFLAGVNQISLLNGMRQKASAARARRAVAVAPGLATPRSKVSSSGENWGSKGVGLFPGSDYPLTGSPRVCVILVQFSDVTFTVPDAATYFGNFANQQGFNSTGANYGLNDAYGNAINLTPTGSASDYFKCNSSGAFTPRFDVYGPVTLSNPESEYGTNDTNGDLYPHLMIRDAVKALDSTVDFSVYDADNDGYLDIVYVIYAGLGEANGGDATTIWPHSWYVKSGGGVTYTADGKILDRYACSAELYFKQGSYYAADGIGTFCHEFSHVLGLADEYDTEYGDAYNASLTPGHYSLMDGGSYNDAGRTPPTYSIFQRNAMGWADVEVLKPSVGASVTLEHLITSNKGYAIKTDSSNEFILLENRQNSSWDSALPGHGMLAWHITYDATYWNNNCPNNDANLQRINLVSANSTPATFDGRPFPGTSSVTNFTPTSNAGTDLNVALSNIAESSGAVTFLVNGGVVDVPVIKADGVEVTEAAIEHEGPLTLSIDVPTGHTVKYVWMTDTEISEDDDVTYTDAITVAESTDFSFWTVRDADGMMSATVDLDVTILPMRYTVTLNPCGGTCTVVSLTQTVAGTAVTLPAASCSADGWTFCGWAAEAVDQTDTAPSVYESGAELTPTADVILYAVYTDGTYYISDPAAFVAPVGTTPPTLLYPHVAKVGKPFKAPILHTNSTGTLTYSSSNPAVASVNPATGEVRAVSSGVAIITVTQAEDDHYTAASASYMIKVVE